MNQENVRVVNVADLADPNDPEGRTYRQVNTAKQHQCPIGSLVEMESGERLFVKKQYRDCDQTPLCALGELDEEDRFKWSYGHAEHNLELIRKPEESE